jgi:Tol biopolymer transport system component
MKTKDNLFFRKEENTLLFLIVIIVFSLFFLTSSLFQSKEKYTDNSNATTLTSASQDVEKTLYDGKILFKTNEVEDAIYVYDLETLTTEKIENPDIYETLETRDFFSQNATWQVFSKKDLSGQSHLLTRKVSSDWKETLLSLPGEIIDPAWSPIDDQIAYILKTIQGNELHIYDLDSKKDSLVLKQSKEIGHPSWSPDGESIVYWKEEDNLKQIWAIHLKDSKTTQIISSQNDNWDPVWGKPLFTPQPTIDGDVLIEALLGNIDCEEDGSFNISFLVESLDEERNLIKRIELSINGTELYNTGTIEKKRVSENLNLLFLGAEERERKTWITLKVWDDKTYRTSPFLIKTAGHCSFSENIPAGIIGSLPESAKEKVYIPIGNTASEELLELSLQDFENKIIFQSDRDGAGAFFMMNPDGSAVQRIDGYPLAEYQYEQISQKKAFSTENNQVVFSKKLSEQETALFLFDLESGWAWQLTNLPGNEKEPIWSPNGKKIAYIAESGRKAEVAVLDLATREVSLVSPKTETTCSAPTWSPSSDFLAFWCENAQGRRQIWTAGVDGSNPVRLSDSAYNEWLPLWIDKAVPLPEEVEN